jgi:hypothetical protein
MRLVVPFPLFELFACLDFGPCPLFLFLSPYWVLSSYGVWQGFNINTNHRNLPNIQTTLANDRQIVK